MIVRDVMSSPVFTIRDDKRLRVVEEIMGWEHLRQEAAPTLRAKKIGCLPVIEGDQLLGIITAVDLLGVLERIETVVANPRIAVPAATR